MQHQINQYGGVGQRVEMAADEEFPQETGVILWQSPEDRLLYIVLADSPLSETDHRHRLVSGDVMLTV